MGLGSAATHEDGNGGRHGDDDSEGETGEKGGDQGGGEADASDAEARQQRRSAAHGAGSRT
jgi:hypothetical protein